MAALAGHQSFVYGVWPLDTSRGCGILGQRLEVEGLRVGAASEGDYTWSYLGLGFRV